MDVVLPLFVAGGFRRQHWEDLEITLSDIWYITYLFFVKRIFGNSKLNPRRSTHTSHSHL